MKTANSIKISVFCYEDEDESKVLEIFLGFFPFNLEEEKIIVLKTNARGFKERNIKIFEVNLTKDMHINLFLENLNNKLNNEQKQLIIKQADSRLDENLNFYIRFDKQKLIKEQRTWITESGDCFHLKINIAAFPRKKEKAVEMIKEIFK